MNRDIYVIEAVTNGTEGFPKDEIVQLGIAAVDLSLMEAESVESFTIASDTGEWSEKKREYIVGKVDTSEVASGVPLDYAVSVVKSLLKGKDVTSFEISNLFYKYLIYNPWDLTHEATVMPSIGAHIPGNLRGTNPSSENAYIDNTYEAMFPDDIYGLSEGRTALDYALKASYILIRMREKGLY